MIYQEILQISADMHRKWYDPFLTHRIGWPRKMIYWWYIPIVSGIFKTMLAIEDLIGRKERVTSDHKIEIKNPIGSKKKKNV